MIWDRYITHYPVIKRAVCLVLKRAERVGDAFQCILDRVGKVIHWENTPFGALPVMLNVANPVEYRITHIEIPAGQVYFGTQGIAAFLKFSVAHPLKEIKIFFHWPVTPGRHGRMRGISPVFPKLLRRQLAYIGKPFLDQLYGVFVGFLKVIGPVEQPIPPVKP